MVKLHFPAIMGFVFALVAACSNGPAMTSSPGAPPTDARTAPPTNVAAATPGATIEPTAEGLVANVIAGTGEAGYSGDGGPATGAHLNYPTDMAVDAEGNLYIADTKNNVIRRIDSDGIIQTVVGTGEAGFAGDGGQARQALLNQPSDVTFRPDGAMYLVDQNNGRVRRVDPDGTISTIVGDGGEHSAGDGGSAIEATLEAPSDIAFDEDGVLYISESVRIRRVDLHGTIETFAGGGAGSGDGGPATQAQLGGPSGIEFGPDGDLYIADFLACRIRAVSADGFIRNISGPGIFLPGIACESLGDGGRASDAAINRPPDLSVTSDGTLYVLEHFGPSLLRRIDPSGAISSVAIDRTFAEPLSMLLVDDTMLFIADRDHEQIALVALALP
ncbi:MAG: hypothetical protein QOJ81_1660 [Chloroflexota bacterium]|nr:hypothetical protein [Chloroflexota bacterium]